MEVITFKDAIFLSQMKENFARVSFPNEDISPIWVKWSDEEERANISSFVDEVLLVHHESKRIEYWIREE